MRLFLLLRTKEPKICLFTEVVYWLALGFFSCPFLATPKNQGGGVVKGTVEDSTGAPIAGAKVKLRHPSIGQELETTSDEDGYFEFGEIEFGKYVLTIRAGGFEPSESLVEVGRAPAHTLLIRLKLAQVKQGVTVSAKPTSIPSAQQNTDFVEFDQRWLQGLPLKEGDPLAVPFLFLEPAATGAQGPKLIVDGVESSTLELPTSGIRQILVNKSPYSAEFGQSGKGRIEVVTRQGSHHHYRGTLSLLLRNSAVDARNPFATVTPPLQRAVSEGQLSGPVGKNLTFFFAGRYFLSDSSSVVDAATPTGPLIENISIPARNTHLFGRLDFRIIQGHKATLSYKFKNKSRRDQGVGGFNLPERGTDFLDRENEARIFDTATIADKFINEARFTFKEQSQETNSLFDQAALLVLDAFNSGGAQISQRQRERVSNLQDIASYVKGRHAFRFGGGARLRFFRALDASNFGGTFSFSSLTTFTQNQPFLFTISQGTPRVSFTQHEFFSFLQDEIRLRSNLSWSLGLRHEFQSNLDKRANFAPRIALAYSPRSGQTVLRAGAGVFYDRQPDVMQRHSLLYEGSRIRQIVISNPSFPNPFSQSSAINFATPSVVQVANDIRLPYLMQAGFGIDRKLGKGRNYLAVEYTWIRGAHLYRTRNVNAPMSITGVRPDPSFININQFESCGTSFSHSAAVTFQSTLRGRFDLLAQYTLSRTTNDTGGIFSLPADNYNLHGERGRADFDKRHRVNLLGTYRLPLGFHVGTVARLNSGIPFNITTGFDDNHDTVANDRPPGVGRNTGKGPRFLGVDVHVSKAIHLEKNNHRPRAEIGLDAFNVLNHVNFENFIGTLSSPFFGRANAANPARELQLSLTFLF